MHRLLPFVRKVLFAGGGLARGCLRYLFFDSKSLFLCSRARFNFISSSSSCAAAIFSHFLLLSAVSRACCFSFLCFSVQQLLIAKLFPSQTFLLWLSSNNYNDKDLPTMTLRLSICLSIHITMSCEFKIFSSLTSTDHNERLMSICSCMCVCVCVCVSKAF